MTHMYFLFYKTKRFLKTRRKKKKEEERKRICELSLKVETAET